MLKRIVIVLAFTAISMLGGVCDGVPRTQAGVTMTCASLPVDVAVTVLDIEAVASNGAVDVMSVEIGLVLADGSLSRIKTRLFAVALPFPGSLSGIWFIPAGAAIQFIQLEEFTRTNSTGFTQ